MSQVLTEALPWIRSARVSQMFFVCCLYISGTTQRHAINEIVSTVVVCVNNMPRYVILLKLILTSIGVTFLATEGSEPDGLVLSTSGDTTVLVLMDIHKSIDHNNVCADFSTRTAELVFTLEWLNQNMVKNGKTPNPGKSDQDSLQECIILGIDADENQSSYKYIYWPAFKIVTANQVC